MKLKLALIGIAALLVIVGAAFACGRVKTTSDLPGTYLADYKYAKEELILNSDGTFNQRVTLKSTGKVDTATGRWNYAPETGYVRIEGYFMSVLDAFGKLNPNYAAKDFGRGSLPADWIFGRIKIGAAEGVLYTKTK